MYGPALRPAHIPTYGAGSKYVPRRMPNLALWLKAGQRTTTRDDAGTLFVTSWGDISGNGHAAVQTTEANQPQLIADAINGRPGVFFNNSHRLSVANFTFSGAMTFFSVSEVSSLDDYGGLFGCNYTSGSGVGAVWTGGASQDWQDNDLLLVGDGWGSSQTPRAIGQTPAAATDDSPHIIEGTLGAATAQIWIDGAAHTMRVQETSAIPAVTSTLWLGDSGGGVDPLIGTIAELIIIGRDLTTAERTSVRQYLATRYGITLA